ncbi:hypothetical protein GCM10023193_30460 [Planotetraspora kaengkrachanensis]|uniref:Uncharacterized protein n=1 Tax=Planotetraspora kaengkrachanensis TaxID=575193 RepID=A0A8J3M7B2_9ACTN|nr:hypothetical protein Pka01_17570 [Planotetraspora kaengkrachanensis]
MIGCGNADRGDEGPGEALGLMPATLVVFGIEGGDFSIGAPFSAPVWSAVQVVAGVLSAELG